MFHSSKKNLLLVVEFTFIIMVTSEYCNILKCVNPNEHVLCKYPDNSVSSLCTEDSWRIQKNEINEQQRVILMSAHLDVMKNNENNKNNIDWDNDLEHMAQTWARQCPHDKENDNCRSLDKFSSDVQQYVFSQIWNYSLSDEIDEVLYLKEMVEKFSEENNSGIFDAEGENAINRIGCGMVVRSRLYPPLDLNPNIGSFAEQKRQISRIVVCNYGKF